MALARAKRFFMPAEKCRTFTSSKGADVDAVERQLDVAVGRGVPPQGQRKREVFSGIQILVQMRAVGQQREVGANRVFFLQPVQAEHLIVPLTGSFKRGENF